jgi:hypothetical protein
VALALGAGTQRAMRRETVVAAVDLGDGQGDPLAQRRRQHAAAERADYQLGLALAEGFIGQCEYFLGNFAAMLAGEARRGPWSAMADFIGLRVSGEGSRLNGVSVGGNRLPGLDASVGSASQSTLKATLWNVTGGYALVEDGAYRLDAIAGLRVGRLEATVDWTLSASVTLPDGTPVLARSGSLGASRDVVDGVIGARGRWQIDSRWAVPWYVDVGTGTSRFTWQAFAGASYAFGWGELLFAWRHPDAQKAAAESAPR